MKTLKKCSLKMVFLHYCITVIFIIKGISGRCKEENINGIILYENATAGSVVAKITCDQHDQVTLIDTTKYNLINNGSGIWSATLKKADLDADTGSQMLYIHFQYTESPDYIGTITARTFVRDVNDVNPQLINQPYITSILEDAPLNSILNLTIDYNDPDQGQGGNVTLTLQNNNNCDSFKLQGKSLILMKSLDFEEMTFYQCKITAEDGGGLKSSASIYITVSDVQDKPPTFVGIPYNWIISEDNATDSVVGTISAVDGDRGSPNQVNYTIFSSDCPGLFALNKTTGELKLNGKPERDTGNVMNNGGVCNLQVMAQEIYRIVSNAKENVVIKVKDINDNSPEFNKNDYTAYIRENMPEQIPINFIDPKGMIVHDLDQGDNSRFNLSVLSMYADYFEIDPPSVLSKAQVFIRVKNSTILDFETHHNITFMVEAKEYATSDKRTRNATITLNIKDVNDNSPVFLSPYDFSVFERSANGTFVATIKASDKDSGSYGRVTYSLSDSNSQFHIDSESGNLTVNGELDRETKDFYLLTVEAIDGGKRQTFQSYTITILDENDNQPVFQRKEYEIYLEENSNSSKIIQITATDADKGNNSELSYSITSSLPPNLCQNFTVNQSTGVLSLQGYLDYEDLPRSAQGIITLNVTASDNGVPSKSSQSSIIIHLTDLNEFSPTFDKSSYSVTVKENVSTNAFVIRVSADDFDGNAPNNVISYVISDGGGGKFKIDSKSGNISISDSLDRESLSSYRLKVTASDKGTPVLSSSTSINITVKDVNDANPIFERLEQTKDVYENITYVDGMKATDLDKNSLITYSINWTATSGIDSSQNTANTSSLKSLFNVNSSSGEIQFKKILDREEFRQLKVVLLAQDENAETTGQTATGTMTINVVDIDDNPPQFNANEYNATIEESAQSGTPITFLNPRSMSASDKDQGNNGAFELEVTPDSFQAEPSRVDSLASVIIKVKNTSAIDYEKQKAIIQLQIKAKPMTNNQMSVTATIRLNIVNVNEDTPTFTNSSYFAEISEKAHANTFITSIEVKDGDAANFGEVNLSLSGESDKFTISNNGSIYFTGKSAIDREIKELYYLTIEAVDGGGRRGTAPLEIRINDENDCSPEFERRDYSVTLKENSPRFERDISVKAVDLDKPGTNNSKVEYSILNSLFSSHFEINPDNGTISVNKFMDFENIASEKGGLNLTICASDRGIPERNSTINVLIRVEDQNEFGPVFRLPSYNATIAENAVRGLPVITVQAVDEDGSSPNKDVFYLIESGGSDKFSINSTSGEIRLAGHLDREIESAYTLLIEGVDRGAPAKTGTTEVVVHLKDVNDEPPRFYPVSDKVAVNETTQSGIIYYVKANDSDSNAILHYSFLWNSCEAYNEKQEPINSTYLKTLLAINHSNGAISISLSSGLDREIVQQISLTVKVNDTMSEGIEQVVKGKLAIDVLDVNDNIPTFNANLTANLTENMPVGIPLVFSTELVVQDLDKDKNAEFRLTLTENGDIFEVIPVLVRSSATVLIKIKNNTELDYERHKNFSVKVVATETSTVERYSSTATIMVILEDSNDNDPQFDNKSYVGKIPEDAKREKIVLVVNATDADSGSYGNVTYALQGGERSFDISLNGEVTLANEGLDREVKDVYYLTILAIDEYGSGRRQTAPLEIYIMDANDNRPIFKRDIYNAIQYEGNSTFERKVIIEADDQDEEKTANSNVTYFIFNTSHNINDIYSNFTLNHITGELKPNGPIDYELLDNSTKGTIKIGVVAKDQGNPQYTSNITYIEISVIDLNDNTPQFEKVFYKGSIPENSTEGQFVNIVKASDDDGSSPNNVVFYLIETGGNDNFRIDSKTGNVTVGPGAHLDKETESTFNLTVLAVDRGTIPEPKSSTVIITIDLSDTNDESPKFAQDSVIKEVLENCTINGTVFQFMATDEDTNSLLSYKILWNISKAYDEKENLVPIETIMPWFRIDSSNGNIIVNSTLDRETAERLILKIFTEDENNEVPNTSQTATGTLTIILKDVNDEYPMVTEGSDIVLNVSESTRVSTELTTLSATDKDKRQTVTFSLTNTTYFGISKNGKITLKKVLDRETQDKYEFQVIATDSGIPPKSSSVFVVVNVQDYNDNAPEFNLTQTSFQVPENATNTTLVATIYTFDKDIGQNANITYTLEGSTSFRIISDSGKIYVDEHLDREKRSSYSLTIVAQDNPITYSEKKNKATKVINIDVTDINDHSPDFLNSNYTVKIPETYEIGKEIRDMLPNVIKVTDLDDGDNSKITYSLNNETYFSISNVAGEAQLRAKMSLRGKAGIFPLIVFATDQGDEPRQSNVTLIIEVIDENINSPVFTQPIVIGSIPECLGTGSPVHQFSATDDDKQKDTNGKVRYRFDNDTGINDWKYFNLDADSGMLSLSQKIDYEKVHELKIRVIAYDMGLPRKETKTEIISIKMKDTNDNPPIFNSTDDERTFLVDENKSGIQLGIISASDPDENSTIAYSFEDSYYKDYFEIKTNSGEINIIKPLDRERVENLTLKVVAKDPTTIGCQSNLTFNVSHTQVQIIIRDVNDNPPKFQKEEVSTGFRSTAEFGKIVLDLKTLVSDKDLPVNSVHRYHKLSSMKIQTNIALPSEPLALSANGTIRTNFSFETSTVGSITFNVVAADAGGNDTIKVVIYIIGDKNVLKMILLRKPDQVRVSQEELMKALTNATKIKFVVNGILSHVDDDGKVVDYKTDLFVHGVKDGKILESSVLRSAIDKSDDLQKILSNFLVTQADNVVKEKLTDDGEIRTKYIFIAVIVCLVAILLITIFVFLNNFNRFKRKLKAAKISTNLKGKDTAGNDFSPVLHQANYRTENPVFEKDIELRQEFDHDSIQSDELDENAVYAKVNKKIDMFEEEVTMDLYDENEKETSPIAASLFLNEALRRHASEKMEICNISKKQYHPDGEVCLDDLESTEI